MVCRRSWNVNFGIFARAAPLVKVLVTCRYRSIKAVTPQGSLILRLFSVTVNVSLSVTTLVS
jgi:hypothetical protein